MKLNMNFYLPTPHSIFQFDKLSMFGIHTYLNNIFILVYDFHKFHVENLFNATYTDKEEVFRNLHCESRDNVPRAS